MQRNLGVPLYYRCTSCNIASRDCLGMQFNLTAGMIILVLLLLPLTSELTSIVSLVAVVFLLLKLGVSVNSKTDELFMEQGNLDARNRELSVLLNATDAITSELDLDHTLNVLAKHIWNSVDCTFVKILLRNDQQLGFVVKAAHSHAQIQWDPAIECVIELEQDSLIVAELSEHRPVILKDDNLDLIYQNELLTRGLFGNLTQIKATLFMPVCVQDRCLGFVIIGNTKEWEDEICSQQSSSLSMSLVSQAAIAIRNAQLYQSLQEAHLEMILGLAETLEARDTYTRDHGERMVAYAVSIAKALGLSPEQEDRLRYATILHDIGKVGIPDSILRKPSKLTDEEYDLMKTHSAKGANIVTKIRFLDKIAPIILYHHERWDGKGYPAGLLGECIPIESRIVSLLDAYDAMISDRVYRPALTHDEAINEIYRCSGTQFDPQVVQIFFKILCIQRDVKITASDKEALSTAR